MPKRARVPSQPTDEWAQLRLRFTEPAQERYELLRPVLLFGQSAPQRARETGVPERTVYRHAQRFETRGMASLVPAGRELEPALPAAMRQAILELKAEYPGFHLRELASICAIRFGRCPSHHTVQRVL